MLHIQAMNYYGKKRHAQDGDFSLFPLDPLQGIILRRKPGHDRRQIYAGVYDENTETLVMLPGYEFKNFPIELQKKFEEWEVIVTTEAQGIGLQIWSEEHEKFLLLTD